MISNGTGKCEVELRVNGEHHRAFIRSADTLLQALREQLELTGAKAGCENGDCGTCTVQINGWPVKSCMMLAIEAVGQSVTTIEGLQGTPIQQAFVHHFAFQCGFCTPGFLIVCHALAQIHPDADEDVIREWLQSNICRCTSYQEIRGAMKAALAQAQQGGGR
ncbi:carbon-monoxide dehydrogenase small subunit [Tumebacillus sp. BK434]|uniref:(2Fe-2S)-binding protein n=1 Tax=Tumebacillus sp. BK434 TaxID=2512169 RepID=UPI001044CC41|nr:(2Fe-2S)-binding protein [Tumebacillus sp. BK434]TCP55735.1 carbon-monoxide dehydrogenase small subunit [Tumebacillus sp. BK434]